MDTILNPIKMTDEELGKWIPVFQTQIESIIAEMIHTERSLGRGYIYSILQEQLGEKTEQLKTALEVLDLRQKSMR